MRLDYEITVTLGPASAEENIWRALNSVGATAFRLNTSHLSIPDLRIWLDRLQVFFTSLGTGLPVILDLQGSKWRLGQFTPFELQMGQEIDLRFCESVEAPGILPVPHSDFFLAAAVSDGQILLNDAKTHLCVESSAADWLKARVVTGGQISPHKGITFGDSAYRIETLGNKDREIFLETMSLPWIRYAISYIKDNVEIRNIRTQLDSISAQTALKPYLIAKLERQPAVDEAAAIGHWVDELWLCRGDLGAELGVPQMAEAAYKFARRITDIPGPVFLAGQVLEHMVSNPAPTRSEVSVLYDALIHGYRGFVLSDEVAVGRYPVESCQVAAMFRA